MDAAVLNFKKFESGALAGFLDIVVGGVTVTVCKAFRKGRKMWFWRPPGKIDAGGRGAKWRDIVTAS